MGTRTLKSSPSILALYARSAVAMLPGASTLPFVPGAGKEIPELELTLPAVGAQPAKVAAYAQVCGFSPRDELPVTYPHVLAFPLHMAIMADGHFPFGAVGLVHVENRIIQRRPIGLREELEIRVRPTPLEPHPRGRAFALVTEVLVDGEPVWESVSRMLRRGHGKPTGWTAAPRGAAESPSDSAPGDSAAGRTHESKAELQVSSEWRLPGDLGRRYGAVSGDRNPIHMHSLSAKAFGFPRAIAHGMWTKARCLATLESRLSDSYSVQVRFRKPILLPAHVRFLSAADGQSIQFAVHSAKRETTHLEGGLKPLDLDPTSTRSNEK